QAGELLHGDRLAQARLGAGVVHQGLGLLAGLLFGQVLVLHVIAERLEQRAGLARRVDALLAADEVAEVIRDLLAVAALDEGDVLLRLAVVLPFGNVDARRQVQLAEIQVLGRRHLQRLGDRHPLAVVQQDRKSTRLNSSHVKISYAVFCLKKKKQKKVNKDLAR